MRKAIRNHLHFVAIITLLTIVMTYPTIVYLFRTDVATLLVVAAGLLAGLSTIVILFHWVCQDITLGLFVCAFALSICRWGGRTQRSTTITKC